MKKTAILAALATIVSGQVLAQDAAPAANAPAQAATSTAGAGTANTAAANTAAAGAATTGTAGAATAAAGATAAGLSTATMVMIGGAVALGAGIVSDNSNGTSNHTAVVHH